MRAARGVGLGFRVLGLGKQKALDAVWGMFLGLGFRV